jgi:hypothetical protein
MADLIDLQTKWLQAIKDLATAGQSYTFPGRSLTRANLPEARETLMLVNQAISHATSTAAGGGAKQIVQATIDTQSHFAR